MIRKLSVFQITEIIKDMCIEVNYNLSSDMEEALRHAIKTEETVIGKKVLSQLDENLSIAKEERIPICQDTGMAVIFLEIGQDIHFVDGNIEEAVQNGVRKGYKEGYLRKSIVNDPIERINTGDNTPAVVHYNIVSGDKVKIIVSPKGFGSENMSRIVMLKPSDDIIGVKDVVIETVKLAGPNACPPVVVGVGVGGNFEKCAILAKKALVRDINEYSSIPYVKKLEETLLTEINNLGIGPAGLGGKITALGVNVEVYPTHIAGLPVAVNISCHVNRHISKIL